ncbi:MAG: hypothetical protein PHC83_05845 [Bacteroidales bacterium]|nr:hypothetical protein [Bacteroidales bacterium]
MAIEFRSLLRNEPGVVGGGVKKYYASIVLKGEVSVDMLVKDIEKFSSLSESDILGVISALEYVVETRLCDSQFVRFNRLGTLYPRINSKGVDTKEEVDHTLIIGRGIRYRPGKRLRDALSTAELKKVDILHI